MAGLAEGMREALSPCRVRPGRLRIPGPRNLGECTHPESPRAAQPESSRLPPLARGSQKVSLCHRKFPAVDVSGLGGRSEAPAGPAGRNSRPHCSRSNDREEPKPLRGNRHLRPILLKARRSFLFHFRAPSAISDEDGGENVSHADLARWF